MIPIVIVKKILLFLVPFVILYFLRKIGKKQRGKSHIQSIDKNNIVEGEILSDDHLGGVHSAASEVNDGKTK